MKLTKSVVLGGLALLALACDRGNNNIQREEAGSVQQRDNWHGNAAPADEPEFREMGIDQSQDTSRGTGAGTLAIPSKGPEANQAPEQTTNDGAGAAAGAATYDDEETGGGSGATNDELDSEASDAEASDQWNKDEYNEPDSRSGTGATGTDSGSGSSDDYRYLDNTSSEADLSQEDRGIPIGREPSALDNTSSEGDEDANQDL